MGAQITGGRLLERRDGMSRRASVRHVVAPMGRWLRANNRPLPPFLQAIVDTP